MWFGWTSTVANGSNAVAFLSPRSHDVSTYIQSTPSKQLAAGCNHKATINSAHNTTTLNKNDLAGFWMSSTKLAVASAVSSMNNPNVQYPEWLRCNLKLERIDFWYIAILATRRQTASGYWIDLSNQLGFPPKNQLIWLVSSSKHHRYHVPVPS